MEAEPAAKEAADAADHVQYFSSYESLYQQKSMLEDHVRMKAYFDSIMENKACFEGRSVLDVGAGTGILSIWAAKAGARKVYAVEATATANHARDLVKANGVDDIVEVLQAKMEEVELPEKVDIIISEWMGYFLVYESMLDTVLAARDKWLLPGGAIYPSHAQLFLAPLKSPDKGSDRHKALAECMDDWGVFLSESQSRYGVDMSPLTAPYETECDKFFLRTANEWTNLEPKNLAGQEDCVLDIDCHTITVAELVEFQSDFALPISAHGQLTGLAGWFEVHFRGSESSPATKSITLSTSPANGYTHWGHTLLAMYPCPIIAPGAEVQGSISVARKKEDQRRLKLDLEVKITKSGSSEAVPTHKLNFSLD